MTDTKKNRSFAFCAAAGLVIMAVLTALDQYTKYLAASLLKAKEPLVLINGVFELEYLENHGAAFGVLQGRKEFIVLAGIIILIVIGYCYYRLPRTKKYDPLRILAAVLAAGAVGNMIDRVWHGYVIDFFYFSLIDFPIFNVADIYVVVSMILLVLLVFFGYKDEDFSFLSLKAKKTEGPGMGGQKKGDQDGTH